ncbi:hypothetical protein V5O48_000212 [Marasmius crinis-equi]|uniref:Uncharacterized protein n=1 Tax=Marasmius crinis-equi TaxID=585013 RepID=A0ABR3G1X3_9AGAR
MTLVLDAVLGLLAGSYVGAYTLAGNRLIEQNLGYLREYGFSRFKAQVKAIKASECKQCAAHDLPISQCSLTPVECSPGVVFVRPQHIIPSLIAGLGHVEAIEPLLHPFFDRHTDLWTPGIPLALLYLARQPSPSLLLLLEPLVPNILSHQGWQSRESMVLRFVRWLTFLPPDPDYHSKTISFMQQVRDWTIRTRSQSRDGFDLENYNEILEILDEEAGVGNVV